MAAPNKVGDGVLRACPVDEKRTPVGLVQGATVLTEFDPVVTSITALALNTTAIFTLPAGAYRVLVVSVTATEFVRFKTGPWISNKPITAIVSATGGSEMKLSIATHGLAVNDQIYIQGLLWTGINDVHYGHGQTVKVTSIVDAGNVNVALGFPTGGTYTGSSGFAFFGSYTPADLAMANDAAAQMIVTGPGPHEIFVPEGNGSALHNDPTYPSKWTQLAIRHTHSPTSDVHLYPKF